MKEKEIPVENLPENFGGKEEEKNRLQEKFLLFLMRAGKKEKARGILQKTNALIWEKKGKDPKDILSQALAQISPLGSLRTKRQSARNLRVPFPLTPSQRESLGLRWLLQEARRGKKGGMEEKLATLLLETAANQGKVVQRRNLWIRDLQRHRGQIHQRWS